MTKARRRLTSEELDCVTSMVHALNLLEFQSNEQWIIVGEVKKILRGKGCHLESDGYLKEWKLYWQR